MDEKGKRRNSWPDLKRDTWKRVFLAVVLVILPIWPPHGYAAVFLIREPVLTGVSGDSDNDGNIDLRDYATVASSWLQTTNDRLGLEGAGKDGDLDRSGMVDFADLRRIAENWLYDETELMGIVLATDYPWMYQNLRNTTASGLTANVSVAYDPLGNRSYTREWEFVLAPDLGAEPYTLDGGGPYDAFWTFAAPSCDRPEALSVSGGVFKVRVTVIGNDYANIGTAESEFAVALLGDVNNDGIVDVADRSITNTFWRTGSAATFTLRDCDLNCDGTVDVADRSIVNAIWHGTLCAGGPANPCPMR
ncbi:MAG: dockerin type I domain-containing protein [Planctomycetota bacterium]|jgi:hypothetical protein